MISSRLLSWTKRGELFLYRTSFIVDIYQFVSTLLLHYSLLLEESYAKLFVQDPKSDAYWKVVLEVFVVISQLDLNNT